MSTYANGGFRRALLGMTIELAARVGSLARARPKSALVTGALLLSTAVLATLLQCSTTSARLAQYAGTITIGAVVQQSGKLAATGRY